MAETEWNWRIESAKGVSEGIVVALSGPEALAKALKADLGGHYLAGDHHEVDCDFLETRESAGGLRLYAESTMKRMGQALSIAVWLSSHGEYSLGDTVQWEFRGVTKEGVVEAVIPRLGHLTHNQRKEADSFGPPRDHVSYLVRVGTTPTKKGKLHWPDVRRLKPGSLTHSCGVLPHDSGRMAMSA